MPDSISVESGPSRRFRRGLSLVVVAASLLPVAFARFPPLYDYYHWIYQGSLVARLLARGASADVAAVYTLSPVPVPNVAASVGIGLLQIVLDPVDAGRVFIALCVLAYGLGFAYLARTFQGRATIVEGLGFAWAYGYLMYKGYLSCELALGIAFFCIGRLYRIAGPRDKRLRLGEGVLLAALGAAAYLANLFGWLVVALAVSIFSLQMVLRGRRREGLQLAATLVPVLLMLTVYAVNEVGSAKVVFYETWSAKAVALASSLMLYMRTDPLPTFPPLLWANVAGWLSLLAVVLANLAPRGKSRPEGSAMSLGLLLLGIGVLLPLQDLGHAAHPDERLILPGLLIFLAALRFRPWSAGRGLVTAALVSLLLLLHAAEYRRASGYLEQVNTTSEELIAPGTAVLSVTCWESRRHGGCGPRDGRDLSLGAPAMKWFDFVRLVDGGDFRSNMMVTSLVQLRSDYGGRIEHWVELVRPSEIVEDGRSLRFESRLFEVVEVFGCPEALDEVRDLLAPAYALEMRGERFEILRRRGDPPLHPGQWAIYAR